MSKTSGDLQDNTIVGRIARALAERIISGEVEPGARLGQDQIATEFGASHVPVREAFRRLEAQGLVTSLPRRGVRVAAFSLDEVKEVAEMRAALEALALRHAAPNLNARILGEAEDIIHQGDKSRDVQAWEAANRAFHRQILSPCAMPRLLAAIDDLHAVSARFLFASWRTDWEMQTDQDHRAILAALRRGANEDAIALLARHVQWVGKRPVRTRSGHIREAFLITG